jgi:two-component system LytT family response regulator
MRIIIADDEPLARKKLRVLLDSETDVEIVAECRNGAQTVEALKSRKADLLMLDIRMPDMEGFEVLSSIGAGEMPLVIFTSAFDQYAVRAFEAHALDYLLKPFDQERLHRALNRARAELLKANDRAATDRILDYLEANRRQESPGDRRLVIKAGGRVIFLDFEEIDWVGAAANYVKLNVGKQSYLLRDGISHISEKLDSRQFVRIHRSTIVNVSKIKELQPVNSGEYIVVLKDGKELSCSRGYRAGLQRLIDKTL